MTTAALHALARAAPETRAQLAGWASAVLGARVARAAVGAESDAPFDYLAHAYFEQRDGPADCVVWASRGSGKTFLAAAATCLDMLHKPGVQIRLLGGSIEQSRRMQQHLSAFFELPHLKPFVDGRATARGIQLKNGSRCEILAQSQRSVRGVHPHILRCDELELFDEAVWEAAQLTIRSEDLGGQRVTGRVEAFSTMHTAGGLMQRIIEEGGRRVFRWGVLDTLERCPAQRPCNTCPLEADCQGRAKRASGHMAIDDAIQLKRRSSAAAWRTEMLCEEPGTAGAVYPAFGADHITTQDPDRGAQIYCGIDFGFRDPTVILWGALDARGTLVIVDEYAQSERTIDAHLQRLRRGPAPLWLGVDPAGNQRSGATGLSPVAQLRRAGFTVRDRRVPLADGLAAVRRRMSPAEGPPRLLVHRRCSGLIDALGRYHYGRDETPAKTGADHYCDALRYLVVNLDAGGATTINRY